MSQEEFKKQIREKLDMTKEENNKGIRLLDEFSNSANSAKDFSDFDKYASKIYNLIDAIIEFQKAHQRVCIFPEYTEHGLTHSFTIMGYIYDILNDKRDIKTETYFYLIMAALCHDLGMTILTERDLKKIQENQYLANGQQFQKYSFQKVLSTLDYVKEENREKEAEKIIARSLHYEEDVIRNKIKYLSDNKQMQILSDNEVKFITQVCYSHGVSFEEIIEINKNFTMNNPCPAGDGAFLLICSLLRVADLLDLSANRVGMFNANAEDNMYVVANKMVDSIKIIDENSDAKCISGGEVENCVRIGKFIQVNFKSDNELSGINEDVKEAAYIYLLEYFNQIETEVKYLSGLPISANEYLKKIKPRLSDKIRFSSFPKQFTKIGMTDSKTMELLTSELLYGDCKVAIRELIQNALDACQARKIIHTDYSPHIKISYDGTTFSICDDGIGMTKSTVENYFLKAGSSLYKSNQYRYSQNQFFHAGRFGLGVFSVFMLTDRIDVTTIPATNGRICTHFIMKKNSSYVQIEDNPLGSDYNPDFSKGTTIKFVVNSAFKKEFNNVDTLGTYIKKTFLKTDMNENIEFTLGGEKLILETLSEKYETSKKLLRIDENFKIDLSEYLKEVMGFVCLAELNSQTLYYNSSSHAFLPQCDYPNETPVVVFSARVTQGASHNRKIRYFIVSRELYEKYGQREEIIGTERVVGLDTFQLMGIDFGTICSEQQMKLGDVELYKHKDTYYNYAGAFEGNISVNACAPEPSTKIFLNDIWISGANRKLALPTELGFSVNLLILNIQDQKIAPVVNRNTFDNIGTEKIENAIRYAIYKYLQKECGVKCEEYLEKLQLQDNSLIATGE